MVKSVNPVAALRDYVGHFDTQQAAADALGASKAFLSRMLLGRSPVSPKYLAKLGLVRVVVRSAEVQR